MLLTNTCRCHFNNFLLTDGLLQIHLWPECVTIHKITFLDPFEPLKLFLVLDSAQIQFHLHWSIAPSHSWDEVNLHFLNSCEFLKNIFECHFLLHRQKNALSIVESEEKDSECASGIFAAMFLNESRYCHSLFFCLRISHKASHCFVLGPALSAHFMIQLLISCSSSALKTILRRRGFKKFSSFRWNSVDLGTLQNFDAFHCWYRPKRFLNHPSYICFYQVHFHHHMTHLEPRWNSLFLVFIPVIFKLYFHFNIFTKIKFLIFEFWKQTLRQWIYLVWYLLFL